MTTTGRSLLLLSIFALIALLLLLLPAGPKLPAINKPELLIANYHSLLTQYSGEVPEVNWPTSIRELNPAKVTAMKDFGVEIIIWKGGISTPTSYIVFTDSAQANSFSNDHKHLHTTKNKLIFVSD